MNGKEGCLKWTGPFCVVKVLENWAYKLETMEGGAILWTWNVAMLELMA